MRSHYLRIIHGALPITNSKESCLLRAAALESHISDLLNKVVFQPLYPWANSYSDSSSSGSLQEIFEALAATNPRKEALFRSLVSTAKTPRSNRSEQVLIKTIIEKVVSTCQPLLSLQSLENVGSFKQELQEYLCDAIEVWNRAQRAGSRIVATNRVQTEKKAWGVRGEHIISDSSSEDQASVFSDTACILFPQFYRGSNGSYTVLHSGYAITTDMALHTKGYEEYLEQRSKIPKRNSLLNDSHGTSRNSVSNLQIDIVSTVQFYKKVDI